MGIGQQPHNNQHRLDEENTLLQEENALPQGIESTDRNDEFFDVLSPMLQEAGGSQGDGSPHRDGRELLLLLEENARLRKLAVEISNLLGDLPEGGVREIEPEVVARLSVIGDQLKAS